MIRSTLNFLLTRYIGHGLPLKKADRKKKFLYKTSKIFFLKAKIWLFFIDGVLVVPNYIKPYIYYIIFIQDAKFKK